MRQLSEHEAAEAVTPEASAASAAGNSRWQLVAADSSSLSKVCQAVFVSGPKQSCCRDHDNTRQCLLTADIGCTRELDNHQLISRLYLKLLPYHIRVKAVRVRIQ